MADAIPAVRTLPMGGDEFKDWTAADVQSQFFLTELPSQKKRGRYEYHTSGLLAEAGTVVLFQFDKRIIASAVFERSVRYEQPKGPYHGALVFDVDSIRVFDPVGPELMHEVWPEGFKPFSQVKQNLDVERFPEFERRLTGIKVPVHPQTTASSIVYDLKSILARSIDATEKETLINERVGQSTFRAQVLDMWASQCCVTGSKTLDAIRASHIKPWRDSDKDERLDPNNGLPLVATLDALFDVGLITFAEDGALLVSERLDES